MFALGLLSLPTVVVLQSVVKDEALSGLAFLVVFLSVRTAMAVSVYRLAKLLAASAPVMWAIGTFIPNIIGVIVLMVISGRASTFLQKAGIKVGLFGASVGETPPPGR